jgi:tetratricopeptide (TPR) repeat protein
MTSRPNQFDEWVELLFQRAARRSARRSREGEVARAARRGYEDSANLSERIQVSPSEHALKEFRATIGSRPVVVRAEADLERQARRLLDLLIQRHPGDTALGDGTAIEFGGIPLILHLAGDELVVHEPDFKRDPLRDVVPGAARVLRTVSEQEAVAMRAGTEPLYAPLHARVRVAKAALRQCRRRLSRAPTADARDSGWSIGAVSGNDAAPDDETITTTVSEILRVIPWLAKAMALPPGYRAVVSLREVESVETDAGEDVWTSDSRTLVRLARSALIEGKVGELERRVNAILESTTREIDSDRPVRQLARRWGLGAWVAYANALTARARLNADAETAAELGLLVDELRRALAVGGRLAGEVAPFDVTANFTTLRRAWLRAEAAEVVEGLLAVDSNQKGALLFQRAVVAADAFDTGRTAEALRESIRAEPRSAATWFLLGRTLLGGWHEDPPTPVVRPDEIVDAFDHALALRETGECVDVDRCVRAVDDIRLEAAWEISDLVRDRTLALRDAGRLDEALASAERLVADARDGPESWGVLGTVFDALCRGQDAVRAYTEAIARSEETPPDDPDAARLYAIPWYARAASHALLGQRDRAIDDLRRTIAIAPAWAGNVPSDERFRALTSDAELQTLVEEGRIAEKVRTQRERETKRLALRGEILERLAEAKAASSCAFDPVHEGVLDQVRAIALELFDAISPRSTEEEVTGRLEVAFARINEVRATAVPASRDAMLIWDVAYRFTDLALIHHLYGFADRLGEGPGCG